MEADRLRDLLALLPYLEGAMAPLAESVRQNQNGLRAILGAGLSWGHLYLLSPASLRSAVMGPCR
jgi:hypothetical protein